MTMRFIYHRYRIGQPVISLDGRKERPRGVIPVTLIGPLTNYLQPSLLDTGADDTVFPEWLAAKIGVDLTNAPTATLGGVGASLGVLHFAKVTFRIADNQERREWRGWAGFTSASMRHPMLGYAGFLQFFSAHFHGDREE